MRPLEEFKGKIASGQVFDALTVAMSEAIELNITTWVASDDPNQEEDTSKPGYRMRTRINIVDGEIENEIGREFATNPAYVELQKLHLEQVQQGREILLNNLASLQTMLATFSSTMSEMTDNKIIESQKTLIQDQQN
ncbi:hypothetical protein Xen7305DRAFT_00040420 [Xenococcus sp. PCC 7305]|uniref:hypothetical protein n=1 Tax=Xenococcus sp. PCC 7305 TaxID=102125 RepID=UPI0002ABD35F|nr:hypothetical protein [Xenococcus sp. PCC 7305]ELS04313.1 hypothetical protein Xen7305DRAFT_00040420 [Xenococcus sp. PCC 7305]